MWGNWAERVGTIVLGGTVADGSNAPVGGIGRLQSSVSLAKFGPSIGINWETRFGSSGGNICRNSHISVNETTSCCLIDGELSSLFGR